MDYINTVLDFLNAYGYIILPVTLSLVIVYGVVNWLANPYRRQNKRLAGICANVSAYPDKAATLANRLPELYRRQWRVVLNCQVKPSLVFEFVPKRKRCHLLWLVVIAAVTCASYVAVYFVTQRLFSYLIAQLVFWLAFGLVTVANNAVAKGQERHARKVFARLVTQFNRCTPVKSDVVEETVRQLQQLNRHEVDDSIIGKASELLRNKGLESNRSVEQQRRINSALNGLLQAYSRKARG